MFLRRFCEQDLKIKQISKPFWRLHFGRGSDIHPPSNVEALRDIQHSMSMVLATRFYIWFIMTLITKRDRHYYKMRQLFYYKIRQFCYKMRQLLQGTTILLQNATFIAKCDVSYKLQQYDSTDNKYICVYVCHTRLWMLEYPVNNQHSIVECHIHITWYGRNSTKKCSSK